ncbi:NAD(P)/FAD-dependent oxidoreductase [Nocardia sp. NPDC057663]|uniref:NAD(P)/FAD-dependent oxidoreductase n=1 Tax=Nocardia sp. NPDC057663 TaxID=3346201 RepID=UPI0036725AB8
MRSDRVDPGGRPRESGRVNVRTSHVVVVGAGPSGAAAARVLSDAGVGVTVLEKEAEVGGRTLTVRDSGFSVDSGAIFVMGSYARTLAFLRKSGRSKDVQPWKAGTALFENGEAYPVRFDRPLSFLRLPQLTMSDKIRFLRVAARLNLRRGPVPWDLASLAAADNGESMEAWSRRCLGDRVHEYVVRPLMEPLTGADLSTISRSFLIGLLREPSKTRLTVPTEGLDRVTAWQLKDVEVRCNTSVTAIRPLPSGVTVETSGGELTADAVVVATDPFSAADLCREAFSAQAIAALNSVQAIPLHHVAFGFARDPWPKAPHDLVVPVGVGQHSDIGVLLGERRRPGSTPPGGQVASVYFDGPRSAQLTEQQLPDAALEVLGKVHGYAEPDFTQVYYRQYGLATAAPGHYRRMLELLAMQPARIRIAGDYLTQSGIESAYIAGERAAVDVLRSLRGVGD